MLAVTAIISLIIGGGVGHLSARFLNRSSPDRFGHQGPGNFQDRRGQNGQMFGGGRVVGQVQSISDGRLTVQTQNNNSQIILTNTSTTYQKMSSGSASDVTTDTRVIVTGQQNPDGSTTATSIQVVPEGTVFPFGGDHQGSPNPNQQ